MKQFLVIALVTAVLLLGCTGQAGAQANAGANAGAQGQQSANGQQPPAGSNQQPAENGAGANAGAQANAGANAQAGASASDQLAAIFGLKGALQYKVAYDIVTASDGTQTSMQTTQYVKGTNKLRMDSVYSGVESSTFIVDKVIISCSQSEGAWSCFKLSSQEDATVAATEDIESNINDYVVVADGTMQVAGTTATCYKVTGKDIAYYRYCASSDGVPLYVKMEGTSSGKAYSTEMTATSYSKVVSDSDFTPPATPTELPAIGGGITGGAGASGGAGGDLCSYCSYMTGSDKEDCLASCAS